jgi:hypothetical protein
MPTWFQPKNRLTIQRLLEVAAQEGWRTDRSDPSSIVIWPLTLFAVDNEAQERGIGRLSAICVDADPDTGTVVGCSSHGSWALVAVLEKLHHVYGEEWWSEHDIHDEICDARGAESHDEVGNVDVAEQPAEARVGPLTSVELSQLLEKTREPVLAWNKKIEDVEDILRQAGREDLFEMIAVREKVEPKYHPPTAEELARMQPGDVVQTSRRESRGSDVYPVHEAFVVAAANTAYVYGLRNSASEQVEIPLDQVCYVFRVPCDDGYQHPDKDSIVETSRTSEHFARPTFRGECVS